ncbi:MAG TPA: alpha-galactosidase, partial [Paludibacter sp.]
MKNRFLILLFITQLFASVAFARESSYCALKNDTLTIGNGLIERTFLWNNGNLITHCVTDKKANQSLKNLSATPDFYLSKKVVKAENGKFSYQLVPENEIRPAYLEVTVSFAMGSLRVKRVYRIYDNSPAIACDTYLRGTAENISSDRNSNLADLKNIEFTEDIKTKQSSALLDQLNLDGKHWHMKAVEFFDVTDWNNNLVSERNFIAYRKNTYRGNLLIAQNNENGSGFFFLKEAPCSGVQLAYSGGDFTAEAGHVAVTGLGLTVEDIDNENWTKTYGCVLGVCSGSELNQLTALRSYQKNIRKLLPA